jgi:phospholipase A1/A2
MNKYLFAAALMSTSIAALADPQEDRCLLDHLAHAEDTTSVAELKAQCAQTASDINSQSASNSQSVKTLADPQVTPVRDKKRGLSSYHTNYILPLTYAQHRPSSEPFRHDTTDTDQLAKKIETKYQLSFKVPLLLNVFGGKGDLYGGYTQRSFWQMYDNAASRPFRETNYEPEVWYQYPIQVSWQGWTLTDAGFGVNHQSNGRGQTYSRSWNRVMGNLQFTHDGYSVGVRPWWRIEESKSKDDNPDISHYMGNFDLTLGHSVGRHHLELTIRNNLQEQNNHGAIQLGWSFPLPSMTSMRGYVQWFNGYGESLIDYNVRQNTIGIGVQVTDW